MLSGIFGKKSDHPLADIKSVQALLEDLPKNDPHKLLMELTEWIESVSENTDFKPDHQFAVLRLLDETAQPHVRKYSREYFTLNELGKFQDNRLWLLLSNFSRHTANAYYTVFHRYTEPGKSSNAIKPQLPLLLARTVNAMVGQLKFICVRYGHIDKTFWKNLAQIYSHAELQQCLDTPVSLYPGMAGNASVKYEVGHLLGWYGCGVHAMKPLYMHLTERLIAQYCTDIDIQAQQGKHDLFSFDLNHPAAPKRIKVDATAHPTTRFISMAGMQPKLESLIKTLGKKVVPEDLTISGAYPPELLSEAAQYLSDYMRSPPLRKNARRSIKISMSVVQGFNRAVERTNAGLNFNQEKPAQWEVEDISVNGFRTVLPAQESDDVRVGSLLGVQPAGAKVWGVAIVRRMMRDDKGQLHVGVELLTNQVTPVALVQSGEGGGAFEDGQTALWLNEKPGELEGQARLLMKAETFSGNRSLLSELNEEDYLLIPVKFLERCFDCDLVQFRLVKQESR